jgi:hypothetical protein
MPEIAGIMVDATAILKAKKAKILADAQREAEAIDVDLRELERIAEKYGLEMVEKANGSADSSLADITAQLEALVGGPAYKAAISVSEQAIRAANRPLEFDELFDACMEKGVRLGGERPRSTLSAYLSGSHSTVQSIRKGVYWLKGVPEP